MAQKNGTKAIQVSGNRLDARKAAANRMAQIKDPEIILDIANI
jgi:hypothetical protein